MERLVQKGKGKGREGKGEVNRIKQQEMKKRNMLDTRRTGKDREMSCAIYRRHRHHKYHLSHKGSAIYLADLGSIYWPNPPNHLPHKGCAIYWAIIVRRSVIGSSASARKGKGEGKGKGRIEKGEVNEGKERKERLRRGKGDIKERIAKEKGREGERER